MKVEKQNKRRGNGHLVGFRIRRLRKDRNLTQSALASQVGIQQSDLCRMETGEYRVALETLFRILSVFEMNIAEFFQEPVPAQPGSLEGEVLDLFKRLDEDDRREVLEFLLFKVSQGGRKKPQADGSQPVESMSAGAERAKGFGQD